MTAVKYWLWLTTRTELSLDGCHRVLERFGTPEAVYYADEERYKELTTLRPVSIASLKDKSMDRADRILADCNRLGVRITTMQDADYPARLLTIAQPPLVLYQKGQSILFDDHAAIAVAGTRNCSEYGRKMAGRLSAEIVRGGGLVVTGVVPGCDYAAATGAIRAGGPVACVLAGGVDVPFDYRSEDLYRKVAENGVLISEYPPGIEPKGRNFPRRNRILTGLCLGVLCVEGGRKSGAMLVAKDALDQNRDVFVVPADAERPEGAGILELMKSGAAPVTEGSEILAWYQTQFPQRIAPIQGALVEEPPAVLTPKKRKKSAAPAVEELEKEVDKTEESAYIVLRDHRSEFTDHEGAVLLCLQKGPLTADEILAETEIPAHLGMSCLTILTLRGLICEEDGGRFRALVKVKAE